MEENEFFETLHGHIAQLPSFQKSSAFIHDQAMGFYYAVAWKDEPWLIALLVMHGILLLLVVVFGRKSFLLQSTLFILMTVAVFASESLNRIGGELWNEFSTQNYFDEHGVFMGVVFAGPLMLILTIQLLLTLATASQLVVTVKRHELGIEKAKQKTS